MNVNIDSIIRSVAVVAVGLPFSLSVTNLTNTTARVAELALDKEPVTVVADGLREDLTLPCINYYVSKSDSKLEREAKTTIDNVMGGEVDYKTLCDYIVK